MIILKNISLKPYNTYGLDYMAQTMIRIRTEKEARLLFRKEIPWKRPLLILGRGSNILFTGDLRGTIISPELGTVRIEKPERDHVIVSAGAGIEWDYLTEWAVQKGFGGIENLSGIPGNVGAVPVQNIGAYGVEVKDYIKKVRTLSVIDGTVKEFTADECRFGYRESVFKKELKGRYLITRVWFKLNNNPRFNLEYGSLKDEVERTGDMSLKTIRAAVKNIRRSKLPDPDITGNAGSFFKNPVLSRSEADGIIKKYPQMPIYEDPAGNVKLAAGWLIEQCGWKGKRTGDAGVHERQALVIVNFGRATGKEIYELSEKIKDSVLYKFGVKLQREVEVIGTT